MAPAPAAAAAVTPSAAALQAAALSFHGIKSLPPPNAHSSTSPAHHHHRSQSASHSYIHTASSSVPLRRPSEPQNGNLRPPGRHTGRRSGSTSPNPHLHRRSPSLAAATMAWSSPTRASRDQEAGEILPARGSVRDAKRRLFQEDLPVEAGPEMLSPRVSRVSRSITPEKRVIPMDPIPVDSSSVEDTSSLIIMFSGHTGGESSSSASGGVVRKRPSNLVKRNNTGPEESPKGTIYAPTPRHELPSLTAAKLASQLSPPGSGRSSPAPRGVADGVHDAYGIPTIALPPVVKKKSSEVVARARASMEFKPTITTYPVSPKQPPPPQLPTPRKALAKILSGKSPGAESDSDQDVFTDAPEEPPAPREAPAPPAPRRHRGPKRRAPGQAASAPALEPKTSTTSTSTSTPNPKPPPARINSRKDSMPTLPLQTSPPLPSRQPTLRSTTFTTTTTTTTHTAPPVVSKPLSRNPTGNSSTLSPPQLHPQPSTTALLASSLASSRTPTPIPPAQPSLTTSLATLTHKPAPPPKKKKPAPPPPLRRRRSAPSLGSSGIKSTLRPPPPPPAKNKQRIKPRHRHTLSLLALTPNLSTAAIDERSRKRYEGVWAANRGYLMNTLCLPSPQDGEGEDLWAEGVHPLVVRDLWGRSRLGGEVLGEIWRLVDRGAKGWLGREEFVVGMWLVDRGLGGGKVPMGGGRGVGGGGVKA